MGESRLQNLDNFEDIVTVFDPLLYSLLLVTRKCLAFTPQLFLTLLRTICAAMVRRAGMPAACLPVFECGAM